MDEEIAGFLCKKGEKGLVQSWRKRFFIIRKNSNYIEYYRNVPTVNTEPLGVIDIGNIQKVQITETVKKVKNEWQFHLVTPKRIYFLFANEENIMINWMNEITKIMSRIKSLSQNSTSQKDGQLYVYIMDAQDLNLSMEKGHLSVYCVASMENLSFKTQEISDFSNVVWNEGFYFDVTNTSSNETLKLTLSVWIHDTSQYGGYCIGAVSIPILSIEKQNTINQACKLRSISNDCNTNQHASRSRGTIGVSLQFSPITKPEISLDDFDMLKVVGKGNFGKVMQVRKKDTGRIYAMKVLRKDTVLAADAVRHTLSEANVLRHIHHPFIVNLKYSFQSSDKLYMVMDYLSGGELFYHLSKVDRFDEDRARFYAAEIISAIGHLHDNKIIYRDLKPENLMLDISGHVCLTDFGLVKEGMSHSEYTTTFCGSPEYLAPEVLLGKAYNKDVDWWSFGTFLYEMLEGLPPFYDENIAEMNKLILNAPLYFDPDHFSPEAKSLIRGLLQRDPKLRLGQGEADYRDIKAHPFFKSIDWDKLIRREIDPSFKPHLKSLEDVRYFDSEFTSQTPKDTPVSQNKNLEMYNGLFAGFTYVSKSFEQQMERRRKLRLNVVNSNNGEDGDNANGGQNGNGDNHGISNNHNGECSHNNGEIECTSPTEDDLKFAMPNSNNINNNNHVYIPTTGAPPGYNEISQNNSASLYSNGTKVGVKNDQDPEDDINSIGNMPPNNNFHSHFVPQAEKTQNFIRYSANINNMMEKKKYNPYI